MHFNFFCTSFRSFHIHPSVYIFSAPFPVGGFLQSVLSSVAIASECAMLYSCHLGRATSAREAFCGDSEAKTRNFVARAGKKKRAGASSPGVCASRTLSLTLFLYRASFLAAHSSLLAAQSATFLKLCPGDESRNYFCFLSPWLLFWFFLHLLPCRIAVVSWDFLRLKSSIRAKAEG